MKKNLSLTGLLMLILMSASSFLHAQDWVSKMQDPTVNFFEVQKSFNKYFVKKDKKLKE